MNIIYRKWFAPVVGVLGAATVIGGVAAAHSMIHPHSGPSAAEFDTTIAYESQTATATRPAAIATSSPTKETKTAATEETTTGSADSTTDKPGGETGTTTAPSEAPTTIPEEKIPQTTETNMEAHVENTSPKFTFTKYTFRPESTMDLVGYFESIGYRYITSKEELAAYGKELLDTLPEQSGVYYLITEVNLFAEIQKQMDVLIQTADTTHTPQDIDARDRYFYDVCGLNYLNYYANGVGLYRLHKVQDVANTTGTYSVYAIYYHSYVTLAERNQAKVRLEEQAAQYAQLSTDYEKVKAVHDYLCSTITYDENASYAHTVYGAIIEGKCVCEGYAKAMQLFMNYLGIPCEIVINTSHAWNEVYIGLDGQPKEWFFVDVTSDDSNSWYNHFLLGQDYLYSELAKPTIYTSNRVFAPKDIAFYNYLDGTNTSRHKRDNAQPLGELSYVYATGIVELPSQTESQPETSETDLTTEPTSESAKEEHTSEAPREATVSTEGE